MQQECVKAGRFVLVQTKKFFSTSRLPVNPVLRPSAESALVRQPRAARFYDAGPAVDVVRGFAGARVVDPADAGRAPGAHVEVHEGAVRVVAAAHVREGSAKTEEI